MGMLLVGLTGGIACGKSTVASELKRQGCQIIDFDQLSREVNKPGSMCYNSLVQTFGRDILEANGSIDRKKLGEVVFSDKAKLRKLNSITHKHIAWAFVKQLVYHFFFGTRILVLDSPLLIETGLHKICHLTVLVTVPEELQLQRLVMREGLKEDDAKLRIASQMKTEDKQRFANYVLDNSGSKDEIPDKTKTLMDTIRKKNSFLSPYVFYAITLAATYFYLLQ